MTDIELFSIACVAVAFAVMVLFLAWE